MSILGDFVTAAVFETRAQAEEAWDLLTEAGVPATVVTDPGMLGSYSVSIEVERDDLERAVQVIKESRTT